MLTLAAATLILQVTLDARSMVADLPIPSILGEVRELWKPYLDVVFRTDAETVCAGTLRLLITDQADATTDARRSPPLGWIEFVDHEQPAQTITVSARAARRMQREGRWLGRPLGTLPLGSSQTFMARALGRAIAHEIGHYLLRSTTHSPGGLMRARFTVADIMDNSRSHFRLDRDEEARLAVRLTAPEWTTQTPAPASDRGLSARADGRTFPTGQVCQTVS
jgi:hypothetical protein